MDLRVAGLHLPRSPLISADLPPISRGPESQPGGKWNAFKVKWQTIADLPFSEVLELHNPWNENKPIKVARDGQEVEPAVAHQLACAIDSSLLNYNHRALNYNQVEPAVAHQLACAIDSSCVGGRSSS